MIKRIILFIFVMTFVISSSADLPQNTRIISLTDSVVFTAATDIVSPPILKPIVVQNRKELPKVYGNWTVRFNTIGKSDLTIKAVKDTTFKGTRDGGMLLPLELRCGNNILYDHYNKINKIDLNINQKNITIPNYQCNDTSYWTVNLFHCGKHYQRLNFAGHEDYADNTCSGSDAFTITVYDPDSQVVDTCNDAITPVNATEDNCTDNGPYCSVTFSCQVAGDYTAEISCPSCVGINHSLGDGPDTVLTCKAPATDKFVLYNSLSSVIAAIDTSGYLYLRGEIFESQGSLTPPANSFIIRNSVSTNVAYFGDNGNLYLLGTVSDNQSSITAPANSLIIRDSSSSDVGYITDTGNLVLEGVAYVNWTDTI